MCFNWDLIDFENLRVKSLELLQGEHSHVNVFLGRHATEGLTGFFQAISKCAGFDSLIQHWKTRKQRMFGDQRRSDWYVSPIRSS